ncbi:MAG: methyltransferase domain-containing protein [Candidatus Diapherotrites archaeon]|nr:methyltransferase domain-containing protein [Candidatus Diapherotrites archaeon]
MKILDLGCGKTKTPGAIGVDREKLPGVDIVHDLNTYPYPFKDNEFESLIARHCLSHLQDIRKTMEEIHRITQNGAEIKITVPYYTSKDYYSDWTHLHPFTEHSFKYFTEEFLYNYYSRARFKVQKVQFNYSATGRWNPLRRILRHYLWNMVDSLEFTLITQK